MKVILSKSILFICCWVSICFPAFAQLEVFPLQHPVTQKASASLRNARVQADTIGLPFFDDFSTYAANGSFPDINLWHSKGGAVVNTNYAVNPPSKGVATLDGLNFLGRPYNFDQRLAQISADTLTSKSINLAGLENAGVFLSFFWQATGLGEVPDATDSLVLEFKDVNSVWQVVRSFKGITTVSFQQEIVGVASPGYFHSGFQFRFRAFGRPSGAYDTWHIDYVYLNRGRNANDIYVRDVALTNPLSSLLNTYTAMPLVQYRANPAGLLVPEMRTSIYNLQFRGIFAPYTFSVRNLLGNEAPYIFSRPVADIPVESRQTQEIAAPIPADLISRFSGDSLRLQYTFQINAGDDATAIPPIDLRRNDTISGITVLKDYYAYDDGTAEYGVGVRQRQGRVASKFYVNTPDTISAVRIYFTQLETNQRGQTFVLRVWSQLDNLQSSVLYEKSEPVRFADTLNKFIEYKLLPAIIVSDTFYVGWQQNTNDILAVGLDKNTDSGSQLFYNTADEWIQNTTVQGSAMIRPVFGQVTTVGIDEQEEEQLAKAFVLYPNPASDRISWEFPGVSQIQVFDILGRQVTRRVYTPDAQLTLDVSDLVNGMYVLHIRLNNRTIIRKIMVQK
ncbi:T9SS type A sorting domain-containing protein [Rhodocytophaga aerolata]|uniref:T9SS type A sorting domain-containing protein n=1 Tax=Rhodocytophaga aerolata TaxID=455078 RepID=A0ABT8R9W4_9BACT|nr:T9SS type A sorting domain-containing protein [Rhodocytophaga aerolata]MDO1448893.1 T9SS type A sorting domain-containing protein [Rhodocytophaga aerolata]